MTSLASLTRHDRPLITDSDAWYPYSYELAEQYRFKPRFGESVMLHKRDGDFIRLPRELCPIGKVDKRTCGKSVTFGKCPSPRPEQVEIFAQTIQFLLDGRSGIVSAYTGWGKTVLGLYVAAQLHVKTLVVTTKDDIYRKWYDDAKRFLDLPDHEVGEIRGNKCEIVDTKFVVAMIQSLSKDGKYTTELQKYFDEFGLVIFDEVQRLPADHFQVAASMFKAKLRLGLSANFKRSDGKELLILAHIGPVRAQTTEELMIPEIIRVSTQWQCPKVYRKNKDGTKDLISFPHEAGRTSQMETNIAQDLQRSNLIAGYFKTCFDKGRKIAAFSTTHEHLMALGAAAVKAGIPKGEIGFYIGSTGKKAIAERDEAIEKRLVLTTYGMMGEGTDRDDFDTCFLCMPRANVLQPVGRIRRQHEGKRSPVVFDFLDDDSPVFKGYGFGRLKWYVSIKADVSTIEN